MDNFGIRIFGAEECDRCQKVKKWFDDAAIGYQYIDANDPANEKLCDDHHVDEMPHIEAYYTNIDRVFYTYKGEIDPMQFLDKAVEKTINLESFFKQNVDVAKMNVDMQEIKKMMDEAANKKKPGCSKCQKKKLQEEAEAKRLQEEKAKQQQI